MQDLLILGLVPGTHIQINFVVWIYGVIGLTFCVNIWIAYQTRLIKRWIVSTFLFWRLGLHRRVTLV
jgi:hypothetical protein